MFNWERGGGEGCIQKCFRCRIMFINQTLLKTKELSFCHKLKFHNPYIFETSWCKPLLFQTPIILSNRIHSLNVYNTWLQAYRDQKIRVCGEYSLPSNEKLACSLFVHPELVMFSFPSMKELGYRLSPENPFSANTPNLYFTHSFVNISALELRLEFLEINWRGSSIPFPVFPQP